MDVRDLARNQMPLTRWALREWRSGLVATERISHGSHLGVGGASGDPGVGTALVAATAAHKNDGKIQADAAVQ
eukprot:2743837-Pyramimonas_sp.AAC.1